MPTRPTPAASKAVQQLSLLIAQCRAGALRPAGGWRTATTVATAAPPPGPCRFVDIGANLLDPMFAGTYHGKQRHAADLDAVLARAADAGVACAIVTAGCLSEARAALAFVRAWRARPADQRARIDLRATVGVHPTRCMEFLPDAAATELQAALDAASAADADGASTASEAVEAAAVAALASPAAAESRARHVSLLREVLADGASDGSVVAIGECGLDYARLHFCPAAVQRAGFAAQLELASSLDLPLFLHCRDAAADFAAACADRPGALGGGGVVHSFDGTSAELGEFLDLGLEIGLNGCSLRTRENLDVAAKVPLERLHLETDAPWCGIKRTHAGYPLLEPDLVDRWPEVKKERWAEGCVVKDRAEPCHVSRVLRVVAASRGADEADVGAQAFANSARLFRLGVD